MFQRLQINTSFYLAVFLMISIFQIEKIHSQETQATIELWPGRSISESNPGFESKQGGDRVLRITKVTAPTLSVYPAKTKDGSKTPAVIVCPGGGYSILAYDKEGTEVAEWLNSIGITTFVLKYTVPGKRDEAFNDLQRAMNLVRGRAKEWNVDPQKIGVLGFSAGGHLCTRLATHFSSDQPSSEEMNRTYKAVDKLDQVGCKPDFCILIYPAYLIDKQKQIAKELPISKAIPPTFIVFAENDKRWVPGGIKYHEELQAIGVDSTLHLFDQGGHGFGLRAKNLPVDQWPKLCEKWLQDRKILSNGTE